MTDGLHICLACRFFVEHLGYNTKGVALVFCRIADSWAFEQLCPLKKQLNSDWDGTSKSTKEF
jgi:hypothetical protein